MASIDLLDRVASIAEQAHAKESDKRERMRSANPEFASFVDAVSEGLKRHTPERKDYRPYAVVINGERYGKDPLEPHQNYVFAPKPEPKRRGR